MDNITHTLIGALVGEAVARVGPRSLELQQRRALFVPTLAIGSNLPDIDLAYTMLVQGRLDYLLHHRGHTHTLIGAVLLSVCLALCMQWRWRRRGHVPVATERIALVWAAIAGPLLHIAMDATNSYGVHPYWPFDDRWSYGDAVFIVEPMFWAASAPLVFLLRSMWARGLVALAVAAGVGLSVGTRMVPMPVVAIYVCASAAMLLLAYRWPRHAATVGVALWLSCTALFMGASRVAEARARTVLATTWPNEHVLDISRSPMPMNPVCWELMLVQSADVAHFTVRRAVLSLRPDWIAAAACPTRGLTMPITAPLQAVGRPSDSEVKWYGEYTMPRAPLRELFASRCEVHALLQFARVPWFEQHGQRWTFGDLRYDREPQGGFAELSIDTEAQQRCAFWGAPWIAPREDLLQ